MDVDFESHGQRDFHLTRQFTDRMTAHGLTKCIEFKNMHSSKWDKEQEIGIMKLVETFYFFLLIKHSEEFRVPSLTKNKKQNYNPKHCTEWLCTK